MMTVNTKLMLEPYKGAKKIESSASTGFATIKQKSTLVGLTLMADAVISVGREKVIEVKKGQRVFISEETLHAGDWAKKTFNLEGSEEKFIIADAINVVAVE